MTTLATKNQTLLSGLATMLTITSLLQMVEARSLAWQGEGIPIIPINVKELIEEKCIPIIPINVKELIEEKGIPIIPINVKELMKEKGLPIIPFVGPLKSGISEYSFRTVTHLKVPNVIPKEIYSLTIRLVV